MFRIYRRYVFYIFFRGLFKYTPNIILKYILSFLAWVMYLVSREHKKIAQANLKFAYDNTLSEEEKKSIIKTSYKSLLFNLFEFFENQYLSQEEILAKMKYRINEDVVFDALKQKRKVIIATAHYGGWELALPYVALQYGPVAVVNRKMDNPLIQKEYVKARNRNNIIMLDKKSAAKGMVKALKNEQVVAVVIDQNTRKGGIDIEFFGKRATATDATSRLALKFDAVIVPLFAVMKDFREYELVVYDPVDVTKIEFSEDEDPIQKLTQLQADIIEKQVRALPHQWFWQHKRWKRYHNEIYKNEQ